MLYARLVAVHRGAAFLFCAVLIAWRAPRLILAPRLWAEEASVYLAYAQSHGFVESLLLVPTSDWPAGYVNGAANLAAALSAHLFPLEAAATVALVLAFFLQLLPIALLLWGRSLVFNTPERRVLACLVLLFAPAVRPVVHLSVINAQIFCALAALILLFEDLEGAGRRRIWAYRIVLLFCGLCGVYTSLLGITFLLRAFLIRRRETAIQCILVATTASLQFLAYVATAQGWSIAPDRFAPTDWRATVLFVFLHHLLQPVVGSGAVEFVREAAGQSDHPPLLEFLGLFIMGHLGWWFWRRRADRIYLLLPLSFFVLAAATSVLAYGLPSRRYAVLSGLVVLLILLLESWNQEASVRHRRICGALVLISLGVGASTFRADPPAFFRDQPVGHFGAAPGRPDWREEVGLWRRDSRHLLRVWPYSEEISWSTNLANRGEVRELREALSKVEDFHLVASRASSQLRVAFARLPADFKIVVRGTSTHGPEEVELTVILADAALAPVASREVSELSGRKDFVAVVTPSQLVPEAGRKLSEARHLEIRARSRAPSDRAPPVVAIEKVEIAPRIEGLLDAVLPTHAWPAGLFHVSPGRFLFHLALYLGMMALAFHDRRGEGLGGRLFVFGAFFGSAGFGFVFLPQSRILEMFCLFVGARLWLLQQKRPCPAWFSLACGAFLGVATAQQTAWGLIALVIAADLLVERRWRPASAFGAGVAICGTLWIFVSSFWMGADMIPTSPDDLGTGVAAFVDASWKLYTARNGLLLGYPFVVLALFLFMRGVSDRVRLLLVAALLALSGWIAAFGGAATASSTLGSPHFAAIFPLFLLLPETIRSWRVLVLPAMVALLFTWGILSSVWTPT